MVELKDGVMVVSKSSLTRFSLYHDILIEAIDDLGIESAIAQGLRDPVTTFRKFKSASPEQQIFFLVESSEILGFVKTGTRRLFLSNGNELLESSPLCVLDFYVRKQRGGSGGILFNAMLSVTKISPFALAFDRPSVALRRFLTKFGLSKIIMQSNHFAISSEFYIPPEIVSPEATNIKLPPVYFLDSL